MRRGDMGGVQRCRFVGALLGTAFGDILGAAVEGMERLDIERAFGRVTDFIDTGRGFGQYTDDTQLTIALAVSLVRSGGVEEKDCACSCAEYFEQSRGYGRSAIAILEAIRGGVDYRKSGTLFFAEGSFGNGAAMRIAPLGLYCAGEGAKTLRSKVFAAVQATHVHPEAIDGALVQALAVGRLAMAPQGKLPDPQALLGELVAACQDGRMACALKKVGVLLLTGAGDGEVADIVGTGVRSAESVPTAIWAALRYGSDPEEAIIRAVNLGGDTDTIGAMTGALVGALHGDGWFPSRWFDSMENGRWGRDALIDLAGQLAEQVVKEEEGDGF